jgi:glucosamine 6-phosphate synthetase-like amidotransferase/phosphosugar isomerase protein
MQVVMRCLKGRFSLMALVAKEKWLMAGCRDYPLAIGKDNSTVYFGTDTETLAFFSESIIDLAQLRDEVSVFGKKKPAIFCATSLISLRSLLRFNLIFSNQFLCIDFQKKESKL